MHAILDDLATYLDTGHVDPDPVASGPSRHTALLDHCNSGVTILFPWEMPLDLFGRSPLPFMPGERRGGARYAVVSMLCVRVFTDQDTLRS